MFIPGCTRTDDVIVKVEEDDKSDIVKIKVEEEVIFDENTEELL